MDDLRCDAMMQCAVIMLLFVYHLYWGEIVALVGYCFFVFLD